MAGEQVRNIDTQAVLQKMKEELGEAHYQNVLLRTAYDALTLEYREVSDELKKLKEERE